METLECPYCNDRFATAIAIGLPDTQIVRCKRCQQRFSLASARKLGRIGEPTVSEPILVEATPIEVTHRQSPTFGSSSLPAAPLPTYFPQPINPSLRLKDKPRARSSTKKETKLRIFIYGIGIVCIALCMPALFDVVTDDGQGDIVSLFGAICLTIAGLVVGILSYFAPLIYAASVKHRHTLQIGLLNVFVGWTILGWIVALIWASMHDKSNQS
jgi:hypothetical protein